MARHMVQVVSQILQFDSPIPLTGDGNELLHERYEENKEFDDVHTVKNLLKIH